MQKIVKDPEVKKKIKEKREEIARMIEEYCKQYLDDEILELCTRLLDKMARKHNVPFLRGRISIWAAAIVHLIARMNFLFDQKASPSTSASDISFHFNTVPSTIGAKATTIEKLVKVRRFDPEFSTRQVLDIFAKSYMRAYNSRL